MKVQEIEIERDGLTLRGFLTAPEEGEFDIVVQYHGFTMNCGRTDDELMYQVSEHLNSLGLATLRVDFNGHGESDGKMEDMTVLNEIGDANAILQYARKLPGVRHIYVLGHSQGGVVASIMAGYYPDVIEKLVLMAPAATLKDDANKGTCMGETYDPHAIPDTIVALGNTIGGFYFRTGQTLPIYEWASHYTGPVCLIHGDADEIVNCSASKKFHETFRDSELNLVRGSDHCFEGEYRQKAADIAGEFLTRE